MQSRSTLGRVCRHTLVGCVLVHLVSAACNISRIHQVDKGASLFKIARPRVCGLESLAFVPGQYRFPKNSYKQLKYVSFDNVENAVGQGSYSNVKYEGLEPLYMKRPGPEARLSRVLMEDKRSPLASGDYLSSRLRSLRDSFPKVSKQDLVKASKKAGLLGLWYAGSLYYLMETRKTLSMLPLPKTVKALQMLTAAPLMTLPWLLGQQPMPQFHVHHYPKEKVDLRVDGVWGAVKKSLRNGVNVVKAYVNAYKSVLLQSGCVSTMHLLASTSKAAGGVGFVHLMRATEPLVTSALSYLFEDVKLSNMGYMSLLPVAAGVAYATYANFDFYPVPFFASLASSLTNCLRRVESNQFFKQNLDKVGKNLTPRNMFATVGVVSSLMLTPFALLEKNQWQSAYMNLMKRVKGSNAELLQHVLLSGALYALVTHLGHFALSDATPVGKAVAVSLKGVLANLTNSFVFDYKLSKQELYGSALAIAGSVLYSLLEPN